MPSVVSVFKGRHPPAGESYDVRTVKRKLTLLALLACAAVTGFVLWGLHDDPGSRTAHHEGVAEPESQPRPPAPQPEPDARTEEPDGTKSGAEPAQPRAGAETVPPPTGAKAGLRVKIVDATGHPITGASVKVIGPDDGGKWRMLQLRNLLTETEVALDGLRPGPVSLVVARGDFYRSRSVKIPPGGNLEVTVPMPDGATVTGIVRHLERGPLAEVTLEAKSKEDPYQDTLRTRTDKEGRFTLRNVPPGRHRFKVTGKAAGYEQHPRASFEIPGPGTYERDLVLGRLALRGVIREAGSGAPIAGARVQVQKPYFASCTSADDGTYAFRDLAPGTLQLALLRDGYETRFYFDVELPADETKVLDLDMVAAAVLHLKLEDDQGRPVTGSVFLGVSRVGEQSSLGTSLRTDENGRATYDRISPGKYVLSFRGDHTEVTKVEATIEPGENSLDVVLARKADVEPVSVHGVVRDAVSGDPLPGVQVRFTQGREESVTDEAGVYRFRGLKPGTYAFFVMRDGYGFHLEKGVVVKNGEATTRDVALRRAAVVHFRIIDAAGRPAVGRLVLAITPLGHDGTNIGTGITADNQGKATYSRIVPGRYKLLVTREGIRAEVETEIRPGENRLELQLK